MTTSRWPAIALALALATAGCAFDEAELVSPSVAQVSAEVGQLRVLRYRDDPDEDRWIDVVAADPTVFREGTSFREEDSRTADADDAADRRRLFTAVDEGRTLLVELNCARCEAGVPVPGSTAELNVWDLVVGDPRQPLSAATDITRPGRSTLSVGDVVVLADISGRVPESVLRSDAQDIAPPERVAVHKPAAGADVYVEVYVARAAGESTVVFQDLAGEPTRYQFRVA